MNNKLNAKDLINIGIFSAMYLVLFFVAGILGFIPIFVVLYPLIVPIVTGIPIMLYMTKVKKFGMITITGIIMSLLMFVLGHSWLILLTGVMCTLIADLIFKSGEYKSFKKTVIGYCVDQRRSKWQCDLSPACTGIATFHSSAFGQKNESSRALCRFFYYSMVFGKIFGL